MHGHLNFKNSIEVQFKASVSVIKCKIALSLETSTQNRHDNFKKYKNRHTNWKTVAGYK